MRVGAADKFTQGGERDWAAALAKWVGQRLSEEGALELKPK